ncbi:Uncharacterized protein BM_BM17717 [Brugia malayi]|uniref:Uncharacterized protein n=1 Tax=Brugia malayi TaxID=6279 RepID=A0A4E9FXQ6_BRUMA|nr:Uncharacterized protein BM_BM17717 [Brugia malayi]VIO97703.1 Uncharacterized protein BM_BM17717 [Brugia malayi]
MYYAVGKLKELKVPQTEPYTQGKGNNKTVCGLCGRQFEQRVAYSRLENTQARRLLRPLWPSPLAAT